MEVVKSYERYGLVDRLKRYVNSSLDRAMSMIAGIPNGSTDKVPARFFGAGHLHFEALTIAKERTKLRS
jgi:hypothetical protein